MSINALSQDDVKKLREVIEKCARMKLEIKDQTDSINDLIKNVSEELDIEKKVLREAIKYEFKALTDSGKGDIDEVKEMLDDAEELLHITGLRK